jgi:hypothetical protein
VRYKTGPLHKRFGSMVKNVVRLALPGGSDADEPKPSPGRAPAPSP